MEDFKEKLKFNIESKKETKNIELVKQYINKEKELCRKFDEEDGIDTSLDTYEPNANVTLQRIMNLLSYREVRVKQAYISKLSRGDNSREMRQMLSELDKDRREKHNLALSSLKGLVDFAKRYNMELIYTGPMLSEKEIEEHKPSSFDARQKMTDSFLSILKDLGDYSTRQCTDSSLKKDLEMVKNKIYKIDREYKVKQELMYDEGDILFEDFDNERTF